MLTKFHGNTNLSRGIKKLVQENYGDEISLFGQPVPYAIRVAEQPGHGVSILELEPDSKASEAYAIAAKRLVQNGKI